MNMREYKKLIDQCQFETNFDEAELYTSIENGFLKFQKIIKKSDKSYHSS